jgi:hypothetical protein
VAVVGGLSDRRFGAQVARTIPDFVMMRSPVLRNITTDVIMGAVLGKDASSLLRRG